MRHGSTTLPSLTPQEFFLGGDKVECKHPDCEVTIYAGWAMLHGGYCMVCVAQATAEAETNATGLLEARKK